MPGIRVRRGELRTCIGASAPVVARDEEAPAQRPAAMVAEGVPPEGLYEALTAAAGALLGAQLAILMRHERDRVVRPVATWSSTADLPPLPDRLLSDDDVLRGVRGRSSFAAPIVVDGRRWGSLSVHFDGETPSPDADARRVGQFADLAAAAIGNAEARSQAARLADEQASLRWVATLAAKGPAPTVVFDAVTSEAARLLSADRVCLARFEPGSRLTMLAHGGRHRASVPAATRLPLADHAVSAEVRRTGRSVGTDTGNPGAIVASLATESGGFGTTVGAPIVVDGHLWGSMTVTWIGARRAPPDAELRLREFTELLDVAIANADSRARLAASRVRMLTAGDEARRRVVRDLHDGAQQRLVHTIVTLKLLRQAVDEGRGGLRELVGEALEQATRSNVELRRLAHGILPVALTRGGLRHGVQALISDLDLRVTADLPAERFSPILEANVYFVVAEALTNVLKHARAHCATVSARVDAGMLTIEVADDGIGGADPAGKGLVGMEDRVSALGGRLWVDSRAGAGTVVRAVLPTDRPAAFLSGDGGSK